MNTEQRHRQSDWNTIGIGVGILAFLLLVVLTGFPIPVLVLALGVLSLVLIVTGWIVHLYAVRLKMRNTDLMMQLTLEGVTEREFTGILTGFREISDSYRDMKRRLGQVKSDERNRVFIEITTNEKSVENNIDRIQEALSQTRILRRDVVQNRRKRSELADQIDRLRRQESVFYNARRSLEDFVTQSRNDEERVRKIVSN